MLPVVLYFTCMAQKCNTPQEEFLSTGVQCGLHWLELLEAGGHARKYMTIKHSMSWLQSGDSTHTVPLRQG